MIIRQPAVIGVALDDVQRRRRAADAVGEDELRRLLDADAAGGDAAILQALRDALERALVFLPDRDVGVRHRAADRAARACDLPRTPASRCTDCRPSGMTTAVSRSLLPQRMPVK